MSKNKLLTFLVKVSLMVVLAMALAPAMLAQFGGWCGNPVPPCDPDDPNSECYQPPPPDPPCEPSSSTCDQCPPPPDCDKCRKSPCYVGSGVYEASATDLTIRTVGFPLVAGRSYQSTHTIDGPMGFGWTSSTVARLYYATYLFAAPSTYQKIAYVIMPDGARYRFLDNGSGTFTPPLGRYDTLVRNADGTFDMTLQRTRSVLHFDAFGALASLTDDYGNALNITYDGNGRVQRIADMAGSGRYVDVFWGPDGRISAIQDSAARQVQYTYNAGALATVTDPASRVTRYSYVNGRFGPLVSQISDNWNRVISAITYDSKDRVKTYTEKGETYTYTYAYQGNSAVTAKADSAGNTYIYPFGASGLVSDTTPPSGGGGPTHTDYYPDGSVRQFIDAVGVKTFYTYTPNGSPLTVTRDYQGPNAVRFEYAYDPNFPAKATSITATNPATNQPDPNWQSFRYEYYQAGDPAPGALHHVYRVHDDGVTLDTLATWDYDSHGRATRYTGAAGGVTDYGYDAVGNLATLTAPPNNEAGNRPGTTVGYDSLGRITSVTDPLNHSATYGYDSLDRVTSVTPPKPSPMSPLNFTTTYSYDNYDSQSSLLFLNVTDPNNRITREGFDQYGQMLQTIDVLGNITAYGYTRGLSTSIIDPNQNVTSYAHDSSGRLTVTSFPDGTNERLVYGPDNSLAQRTDRKNQTVSYSYDHFKRLARKTYPNSTSIIYTYTGQKLTQVADSSVAPPEVLTYAYDSAYRVSGETQGPRGTINYQYNADDRVASYSVQGGDTTTYSYYPDGSPSTLAWSAVSGSFNFAYSLIGQYQRMVFPNGQTRNFAYDDLGRLTQLTNLGPTASNLATFAYGYDRNHYTATDSMLGQRTSMTADVPPQGFAGALTKYYYDSLYHLTRVDYPTPIPFNGEIDQWTYDSIGNRLASTVNGGTKVYAYFKNAANPLNGQRLSSDGINTYTYDANGSQITSNGPSGSLTFGYDADGRQISIGGAAAAAYTYDFKGRRTSKTENGVTTTYLYDGAHLIVETSPATRASFVYNPGLSEPVAMYRDGVLSCVVADGLGIGSVVGLAGANGTSQSTYAYDVWGVLRGQSGTAMSPFGFTGRESGLAGQLFFKTRYYQPALGRFSQEDTLPQSFSLLYGYVFNDPVDYYDPGGLQGIPGNGGPPFQPIPTPPPYPQPPNRPNPPTPTPGPPKPVPLPPYPWPKPQPPCQPFRVCMRNCFGCTNPWILGVGTAAAGGGAAQLCPACAPWVAAGASGWLIGTGTGCTIYCMTGGCYPAPPDLFGF